MELFSPRKTHILFLANVFPEDCPNEEEVLLAVEESFNKFIAPPTASNVSLPSDLYDIKEESEDEDETLPNIFPNFPLAEEPALEVTEYDELPEYFIDLKSWPKSTNLLCSACDDTIRGIPWIIPLAKVKKVITPNEDDVNVFFPEATRPNPKYFHDTVVDTADITPSYRTKEVIAFRRHKSCFCTPFCASRFIRCIRDPSIPNEWEAMTLLLSLYQAITGKEVEDIPIAEDKIRLMQYCGPKGLTRQEFRDLNEAKRVLYARNVI
jgi:hypothetical protein